VPIRRCRHRLLGKTPRTQTPLRTPERLFLIPNGVDPGHYAPVLQPGPIPPSLASLVGRGPIFGYTGTIHPDRVDVALIMRTARLLPGSLFVLVGPNHLSAPQHANLQTSGVVLLPAVPYAHIPDYMRAFDVCITPHKMTPFTESLNPIKLWEYLAAGKPIVSTDVAGFRDYPDHVRIARTAEQFAAALKDALAEIQSPDAATRAAARQAEARQHSWESRVDRIEMVMAGCQPKSVEAPVHA